MQRCPRARIRQRSDTASAILLSALARLTGTRDFPSASSIAGVPPPRVCADLPQVAGQVDGMTLRGSVLGVLWDGLTRHDTGPVCLWCDPSTGLGGALLLHRGVGRDL